MLDGRQRNTESGGYVLCAVWYIWHHSGRQLWREKLGAKQRLWEALDRKGLLKEGHLLDGTSLPQLQRTQNRPKRCTGISSQPHPPMYIIPFPPDPTFVEPKEMSNIRHKISRPGARVVLVGLGGIGYGPRYELDFKG